MQVVTYLHRKFLVYFCDVMISVCFVDGVFDGLDLLFLEFL